MLPKRICSECPKPVYARGMCENHYHQWWYHHKSRGIPLPERICTVEGCDKAMKARGLCKLHYSRLLRHGSVESNRPTLEQRFWSNVEKGNECWMWVGGGVSWNGYARIKVEGKRWLVHRLSWSMANGDIPAGMVVCHSCDEPLCVRPEHLFVGTQSDNIRDCVAKGRHPWTA